MISDREANFVYVGDQLAERSPSVDEGLERLLSGHGIGLGVLRGVRDVWARDFMPIPVDRDGTFVLFRYSPDYLWGYDDLVTDAREIIPQVPEIRRCEFSNIVLDGGNVVRWQDAAIATDKIYKENPGIRRSDLRDQLRRTLRVETLIVIPKEPFDPIGHSDGMVRWLDARSVVVNDYHSFRERFRKTLRGTLHRHGLEVFEIPYLPEEGSPGEIPPALGNWVNFLRVAGLLIVPTFGVEQDQVVLGLLKGWFPGLAVEGLDCRELAKEGGLLNCVTWQVTRPGRWIASRP